MKTSQWIRRALTVAWLAALAGSLTGCPTVDLGETPVSPQSCRPDPLFYEDRVWPEFLAPADATLSCVDETACHRLEDGRSALRLNVAEPIDHVRNYDVMTRFLNCGTPTSSSALTKPQSGTDPHGGGELFAPGSPSSEVFLQWFDQ